MQLDRYDNSDFDRGAGRLKELAWLCVSGLLVNSWLPGSGWRKMALRAFGAKIGDGVVIKPYCRVKFPWRLTVGNYVWLGESVWIDNLAPVSIGTNSCVSQGVFLCTGSHDWKDPGFRLVTKPITVGEQCWIGAFARLCPGSVVDAGAVVTMGTVAKGHLEGGKIHNNTGEPTIRPR